jgi:hypothetical protein
MEISRPMRRQAYQPGEAPVEPGSAQPSARFG